GAAGAPLRRAARFEVTAGYGVSTRSPAGRPDTSIPPSARTVTSTADPAIRSPRTVSGPNGASGRGRNVTRPPGTSGSTPSAARTRQTAAVADQACGRQAAG